MVSTKSIIVIVVVVILIVSGVGYYISTLQKAPPTKQTSLVVDESAQPDSLDPAVTYTTPGWEIDNQIYQGLVAPNGTSYTTYIGDLASSWTVSSDLMNYTFNLRQNVTFSNNDTFNAYVEWYSLYRTLIMNQAPAWILGQNFNYSNGANFTVTANQLNTFNYTAPTQAQLNVMEFANQSFQVTGKYQIILHLGYGYNGYVPYTDLLATLITPMAAAVDPAFVGKHGGVVAGSPNSYLYDHTMGTGFYVLKSWINGQSVTMTNNTYYWGAKLSSSQLNNAIAPAILKTVTINYKSATTAISDIKSGLAQIIESPISNYNTLKNTTGVTTKILPPVFGSSQGAFYIYMTPNFAPFQNLTIRQAVSYAVDYQGIIHTVFGGHADQWIGPIPPGFPHYNESTSSLTPYHYNPWKAANLVASSGYKVTLANGTVLNSSGTTFPTVNFLYTNDMPTEAQVAQILKTEFAAVGININPVSLSFAQYQNVVWSYDNTTGATQYPMGLNFYTEDYTASSDYVDALANGYYVGTSLYFNNTVFNLTINATSTLNTQHVVQNYTQITQAMYNSYWFIWTYVPYFLSVNTNNVAGIIPNPAGSGAGYFMYYNTVHFT